VFLHNITYTNKKLDMLLLFRGDGSYAYGICGGLGRVREG